MCGYVTYQRKDFCIEIVGSELKVCFRKQDLEEKGYGTIDVHSKIEPYTRGLFEKLTVEAVNCGRCYDKIKALLFLKEGDDYAAV